MKYLTKWGLVTIFLSTCLFANAERIAYAKYEPYLASSNIEHNYRQLQSKWQEELIVMQKVYTEFKAKRPSPDMEAEAILSDYAEVIATLEKDLKLTAAEYYDKVYAYGKTLWKEDRIVTNEDFRSFLEQQLKQLEMELELELNNPKLFARIFIYQRTKVPG